MNCLPSALNGSHFDTNGFPGCEAGSGQICIVEAKKATPKDGLLLPLSFDDQPLYAMYSTPVD